ncbi:MAG TPA: molybdopterin-dependent oxidoreductase [Candidatus Binataceae bacterium]
MARILTRRQLLTGSAAAALLAGCDARHPVTGFLNRMLRFNERFEGLLFSPSRLAPEEQESALTPESALPVYFIADDLPLAPDGWSLKVGGAVARPGVFTLDQLKAMPRTSMRVRHHCVEGWSAVAQWHGARISELARVVGIDPQVRYVEFRSFDAGYWSSWDLGSALHPQTLLAYGINSHELGPDHGAPLRVYSAIKLGYKSVKYLTEVNFLPERAGGGYWEDQGYDWFAGV